jgi:hypothetical protein
MLAEVVARVVVQVPKVKAVQAVAVQQEVVLLELMEL